MSGDIMDKHDTSWYRRWLNLIVGNIFALALLLLLIEGAASYLLFAREAMTTVPLAEREHTKYDPVLGWSNIPGVNIPDMYGPGIHLQTNSQGFRNDYDFDESVPAGKIRIICSGDSFTFGYGVDNDQTWCQQLTALDPRLETVNMAQGGYGVDQAYLWYKRDGSKVRHDVQILAFITDDFYRMQRNKFLGYSKPVIEIENGTLVARNTPVPRTSYTFSFFTSKIDSFNKLRTVEFINKAIRIFESSPDNASQQVAGKRNEETRDILLKLFESLSNTNKERNSKLVLVYLPTKYELNSTSIEDWMNFIEHAARTHDIPFINIMSEFQSMPREDAVKLFIPSGKLKYPGAAGHLNDRGNEMVSEMIYKELRTTLPAPQ